MENSHDSSHQLGMRTMSEWPHVARIAHCEGGIVAVSNPGADVTLEPTPNGDLLKYSINQYSDFIKSIRNQGIQVLGCEFITNVEQANGWDEQWWRPVYDPIDDLKWPFFDVQQKWSQIANASAKKDQMSSYVNAAHISTQLRICGWRLLDLSQRYERHQSWPRLSEQISRFLK